MPNTFIARAKVVWRCRFTARFNACLSTLASAKRDIRHETVIVIAKGICHIFLGIFTPWSAALAQWIGSGEWPSKIVWVGIILPASAVGGASQLLAFLSGAYQKYLDDREPIKNLIDAQEAAVAEVKGKAKVEEVKAEIAAAKSNVASTAVLP